MNLVDEVEKNEHCARRGQLTFSDEAPELDIAGAVLDDMGPCVGTDIPLEAEERGKGRGVVVGGAARASRATVGEDSGMDIDAGGPSSSLDIEGSRRLLFHLPGRNILAAVEPTAEVGEVDLDLDQGLGPDPEVGLEWPEGHIAQNFDLSSLLDVKAGTAALLYETPPSCINVANQA